ncbi:MAG: hypothetical protein HRU00_17330 [Myxococcales bacterium]|nr:hypothetical protein [Myxococcales bacterium]
MTAKPTQQGRPRNWIFAELRRRWIEAEPGRSSVKLGEHLGFRKQTISSFATGAEKRVPPWPAVFILLSELGLELRINADAGEIILTKRSSRASAGDATFQITQEDMTAPF